jgi:hypothetical protein
VMPQAVPARALAAVADQRITPLAEPG